MQVPNPEFEGQTKGRLGNPEVRKIVDTAVCQVGAAAHMLPALSPVLIYPPRAGNRPHYCNLVNAPSCRAAEACMATETTFCMTGVLQS